MIENHFSDATPSLDVRNIFAFSLPQRRALFNTLYFKKPCDKNQFQTENRLILLYSFGLFFWIVPVRTNKIASNVIKMQNCPRHKTTILI